MTSDAATGRGSLRRSLIRLNGTVQGVGFRPFVYRLARECRLDGFVSNSAHGVVIEVEGQEGDLLSFQRRLHAELPPLATILEEELREIPAVGRPGFSIRRSIPGASPTALVPPDVGVCDACLREMRDPADRRHGYAFINCTDCGPRFTITRAVPYDRIHTSMDRFAMCGPCRSEYDDPGSRRFHAQPNACPGCGPHLRMLDGEGRPVSGAEPVDAAAELLRRGGILALRGMGGFHLAADALDEAAVSRLRERKGRREKAFAVMCPDLESVRAIARPGPAEEEILVHPSRPIVLVRRRSGQGLAPSVAPGSPWHGVMLPSTPLHHLLLGRGFPALVMTSGNITEEPIAIGNEEALERLRGIADAFLVHDREILQRCDDSVVQMAAGEPRILRRARGHIPVPIVLRSPVQRITLAVGGQMKSTVALASGRCVQMSQHLGELESPQALRFFESAIDHLKRILDLEPEAVAHDLHPDYLSTRWARSLEGIPQVGVQHHHAHFASALAENGHDGPAVGLILDGTGYGPDGTIWGGEILAGDAGSFRRLAWLEPVPMPGGEAAIRQPWRMALSHLQAALGEGAIEAAGRLLPGIPERDRLAVLTMVGRRLHAPMTSSCGRLFDAVSALLGIRLGITYEAQAAIELEAAAEPAEARPYREALEREPGDGAIPLAPLIGAVAEERLRGISPGIIAARFHATLAHLLAGAAAWAARSLGLAAVALSGGVFQNGRLLQEMITLLEGRGLRVLTHRQVPFNDGGLALGQVAVADAVLRRGGTGAASWGGNGGPGGRA